MKIETTNLFNARKDKKLMRVLYSLTMRGYSEMRAELVSVCDDQLAKRYQILLVKIGNKIVGWSLLFPWSYTDNGERYYHARNYNAYFYVAREYRRKGIGSFLYKEAEKICNIAYKRMHCSAWDAVSSKFFTKHKARIL